MRYRTMPGYDTGDTFYVERQKIPTGPTFRSDNLATVPKYRAEVKTDEDGETTGMMLYADNYLLAHLYQKSKRSWWVGFFPDDFDRDVYVNLDSKKRITVTEGT